jgi:lipopolysaccharide transport system permease protein
MRTSLAQRSLGGIATSLLRNRYLILQMVRREVSARYRGSVIGVLWSLLLPLIMLAVYTFIFGVTLEVRWSQDTNENWGEFAIILFTGLILHQILADCITRAPLLMIANASYVKRVIFPLEILAWTTLGAALFQGLTGFVALCVFRLAMTGALPWTIVLVPVIVAPFALICLGLIWMLSAIGTFVRDVAQVITFVPLVLLFLGPVLFPLSALPPTARTMVILNPLTVVVMQTRNAVLLGQMPDWSALAVYSIAALVLAWAGLYVFLRSKSAFADVL